jgi:hypothetical protein
VSRLKVAEVVVAHDGRVEVLVSAANAEHTT